MKRSEKFNDAITELQQFLLSLGDNASCILTFAENVCDEHGEAAEIGRFIKALQEHLARNYKELRSTIEHMEKEERTSGYHGAKAEVKDQSSGRSSNEYLSGRDHLGSQDLRG